MTRTILATLTALSLTLVAAQGHAASFLKVGDVPGESQATGADRPVAGAEGARRGHGIIIIDMATGGGERDSDGATGRDAAGG